MLFALAHQLVCQAAVALAGVISEIKQAWRDDRSLQDPKILQQKQKLAQDSLAQLQHYCGMRDEKKPGDVYLGGGTPMQPKPTAGGYTG